MEKVSKVCGCAGVLGPARFCMWTFCKDIHRNITHPRRGKYVPVVHQQHEEFHSQDSEDSGYSSNTSHYTPQKKRRGTYSSLFERPTTLLLNSRPGATEEGGRGMMYPSPETTPHNRTELVIGRGEFTPLNNSRLVVSYSSIPTTPSSDKPAGFFKQLSAPPITGKRRDNNNREL